MAAAAPQPVAAAPGLPPLSQPAAAAPAAAPGGIVAQANGTLPTTLSAALPPLRTSRGSLASGGNTSYQDLSNAVPASMDSITKMLFISAKGTAKQLRQMIRDGQNVNAADYDGRTPLHLASSEGRTEIVEILIAAGANVNALDRWSSSPLDDAETFGHEDTFKVLKAAGALNGAKQVAKATPRTAHSAGSAGDHAQDWEIDPSELDLGNGKLIGAGAFGEIWKVTWRGTEVAVKKMLKTLEHDEVASSEFRDEIALLPKLQHPHIVQFLGACTRPGYPLMIVTEFLRGGNLHDLMFKQKLKKATCIGYALDIARGMNYLHMRKPQAIVHRDLKPRNILVSEAGHLKVADFGLSKLVAFSTSNDRYQMTGETGSYRYMAPEVFRHEAYDKSVDVYSFAVILYEMFEGKPAFQYQTPAAVAKAMAVDGLRPPITSERHYPEGCQQLIKECWSENPVQRPTFDSIIKRLEALQSTFKEKEGGSAPAANGVPGTVGGGGQADDQPGCKCVIC